MQVAWCVRRRSRARRFAGGRCSASRCAATPDDDSEAVDRGDQGLHGQGKRLLLQGGSRTLFADDFFLLRGRDSRAEMNKPGWYIQNLGWRRSSYNTRPSQTSTRTRRLLRTNNLPPPFSPSASMQRERVVISCRASYWYCGVAVSNLCAVRESSVA